MKPDHETVCSALILSVLAAVIAGCDSTRPDLDAERKAIMAADAAWLAAVARKDLEATVGFWTDDATVLPPDMPALEGKAAIRDYVDAGFNTPGFGLSWKSGEIVVAADGKMAYQFATNEFTAEDATGEIQTARGKGVVIWRKEPDGAWRSVVDIWNGAAPQGETE
jgi:ketosteroid isomerase-like protein